VPRKKIVSDSLSAVKTYMYASYKEHMKFKYAFSPKTNRSSINGLLFSTQRISLAVGVARRAEIISVS
jgi:hypothetical protein